jgi:nitrogen regulatory protein PII 2
MKEIMAVIRMNMMNKTKRALVDIGVSSLTAKDVSGRGRGAVDVSVLKGADQGYEEAIAQLGKNRRLVSKRLLSVIVPEKDVKKVVDTIISTNQTGKTGDGKIFVLPVMDAVRIRTGEDGDKAIDEM